MRLEIAEKLKQTKEQTATVGPLVEQLVRSGWELGQIIFGREEWRVPKSPSEATKREKGHAFAGFPVDVAVFDETANVGDPDHLLFIIECKRESDAEGLSQLQSYFVAEPHAHLGVLANNAKPSAPATFVFRTPNGRLLVKRQTIGDLPKPGEPIEPNVKRLTFDDLVHPDAGVLRQVVEDLLDKVVSADGKVTRRESQLDQLCNLILLKLESDKKGRSSKQKELMFRPFATAKKTGAHIRAAFDNFVDIYPETFTEETDRTIRFNDGTIHECVNALAGLGLLELGVTTVSVAFQVLRSEALKTGGRPILHPTKRHTSRHPTLTDRVAGLSSGPCVRDRRVFDRSDVRPQA